MDHDQSMLKHTEVTERIIKVFYGVYNELGHGFLEAVYANAMAIALVREGLTVQREVDVTVFYGGEAVGEYRPDAIVNGVVLVEYKAVQHLDSSHTAQVLNALRATTVEIGLLMNFGLRAEFKRFAFENNRKKTPVQIPDPRTSASIRG